MLFCRWWYLEAHNKLRGCCCPAYVILTLLYFLNQRFLRSLIMPYINIFDLFNCKNSHFFYSHLEWWCTYFMPIGIKLSEFVLQCLHSSFSVVVSLSCRRSSRAWLHAASLSGRGTKSPFHCCNSHLLAVNCTFLIARWFVKAMI